METLTAEVAAQELVIVVGPDETKYRPGDPIDYEGLLVAFHGKDVTEDVTFSAEPGTTWERNWKTLEVTVTYEPALLGGPGPCVATFQLKRKRRMLVPLLLVGLAAAGMACAVMGYMLYNGAPSDQEQAEPAPASDGGAYLIPKQEMTDEEAQELVNRLAAESRFTVNIAPVMKLDGNGRLRVNFIVPSDNNGISERLVVEQDGQIVYMTTPVEPGRMIEWGEGSTAHEGAATATVYAVRNGVDEGNPASVEVSIERR